MSFFLRKNWFPLCVALSVILAAISFSYYCFIVLPGTEVHSIVVSAKTTNAQVTDLSFLEALFSQVFAYNIGYLGFSVFIILALGVIYTIFNIRPMETKLIEHETTLKTNEEQSAKELKKLRDDIKTQLETQNKAQEESIKSMESTATSNLENLGNEMRTQYSDIKTKLEADITGLNTLVTTQLANLKFEHRFFELNAIYNEHYLWQIAKVHVNDLDALVKFLEKSVEYNMLHSVPLALTQVARVLSIPTFSAAGDPRQQDFQKRLTEVMSKLPGLQAEKDQVTPLLHKLN